MLASAKNNLKNLKKLGKFFLLQKTSGTKKYKNNFSFFFNDYHSLPTTINIFVRYLLAVDTFTHSNLKLKYGARVIFPFRFDATAEKVLVLPMCLFFWAWSHDNLFACGPIYSSVVVWIQKTVIKNRVL